MELYCALGELYCVLWDFVCVNELCFALDEVFFALWGYDLGSYIVSLSLICASWGHV
jgi:hypothetical protein